MQAISRSRSRSSSPAELVLQFREGSVNAGQKAQALQARQRKAWRRALLRRLSHVTSRLERTPEYRASLQRVLDRGAELQAVLDPAQRERWLALEEAFFDHSSQLHRAYFRAGVEFGQSRLAASVSSPETTPAARLAAASLTAEAVPLRPAANATLELEILITLARWLGTLLNK